MNKIFGNDRPIASEKEWDEVFEKQCKTVAKTLKISINEARKRMTALKESGLLKIVNLLEPEGQKAIDSFLCNQNWETNPEKVLMSTKKEMAFTEVLLECLDNKGMVQNFDRLRGTNIWEAIETGKSNANEKQFKKWIDLFSNFVREYIWARLPDESFK